MVVGLSLHFGGGKRHFGRRDGMIDEALRAELHERLLAEQKRLKQEIGAMSNGALRADVFQEDEADSVDQHPADDASELFEREKNLTVRQTLEVSLREVNEALRKFEDGTYGTCADCGKPISERRLRALPEATHCIECQSKLERKAQAGAR
jgi:DnaK suppressor protein